MSFNDVCIREGAVAVGFKELATLSFVELPLAKFLVFCLDSANSCKGKMKPSTIVSAASLMVITLASPGQSVF